MVAIDASVALILYFREDGFEAANDAARGGVMSAVNVAEVLSRLARVGAPPAEAIRELLRVDIEIAPFTLEHARIVAELAPLTRAAGLALGDRACLALAMQRGVAAATADRAWSELDLPVEVQLVRG
jgi:PIN domain nuclease of toxin-antitoxin system